MVFKKKPKKDTTPGIDRIVIDLWKAENDARQADGLPPISFSLWYQWYSQRHGNGQGGAKE